MGLKGLRFLIVALCFSDVGLIYAQVSGPTTGEITVQLVQGLDSSVNPRAMSQGRVTKSTNPSVPVGSQTLMGLRSDPINGGYTVKLMQINVGRGPIPASSSSVVAAPDIFNKMQERLRAPGQPQDAVTGTRVFLPEKMIVRFTLEAPPVTVPVASAPVHEATARPVTPPPPPKPVTGRSGDFPLGPGLPVLHTDRTPDEGTHWIPLVSRRYGFVLLVEDHGVEAQYNHTHTADDPDFIASYEDVKRLNAANPKESRGAVITVFTKPATQTLDAAVRAQLLSTLNARWRPYCHLKKAENQSSSGVEMYTFTGTSGPALQAYKKADLGDTLPCDPWEDTDSANDFVYKPSESKTMFFFVALGQDDPDFDINSLRFLPPTTQN